VGWTIWVSNPGRDNTFFLPPKCLERLRGHTSSCSLCIDFFPGAKAAGAGRWSMPSGAVAKNDWSYTSALPVCLLGEDSDKFTFTFTLSPPKTCIFVLPPSCHTPCLFHPLWMLLFRIPKQCGFISWPVAYCGTSLDSCALRKERESSVNREILIVQLSTVTRSFLPLRYSYSLEHPVFE